LHCFRQSSTLWTTADKLGSLPRGLPPHHLEGYRGGGGWRTSTTPTRKQRGEFHTVVCL
jgi:hypothetical protein